MSFSLMKIRCVEEDSTQSLRCKLFFRTVFRPPGPIPDPDHADVLVGVSVHDGGLDRREVHLGRDAVLPSTEQPQGLGLHRPRGHFRRDIQVKH